MDDFAQLRKSGFIGLGETQYKSGSRVSRELKCWNPVLQSADRDMLGEKAVTEARAQDLARNNGFIKGALQNAKDRVVGAQFKLQHRPRHKMLGLELSQLSAWVSNVEQRFQAWAEDPDCYVDARRQMTFSQMIREAIGQNFIQGESFHSREWKQSKSGFSTCFLSVEPERIDTPQSVSMDESIRAGIKSDKYGEAIGYWVKTRHSRDIATNQYNEVYHYKPKLNEFGWLNFIHTFERERPNQTRGFSPLASIIQKLKMLDRYEDVELEASILAATYAMVLKSDAGAGALDALSTGDSEENGLLSWMQARDDYNSSARLKFDGVTVPQLFPNEELQLLSPNHPNGNSNDFKSGMHLHIARGVGTSFEELTGDYSKTTYSSARASQQNAWEHVKATRQGVAVQLATNIFRLWLDEAVVKGLIPLPANLTVADYFANRSALTFCNWIGAGRLIIDEVKHENATKLALGNGTKTLAQACAEAGMDWEEVAMQRAFEKKRLIELGLATDGRRNKTNLGS